MADGADLDYELIDSYELTLTVSDQKDAQGNTDSTVDGSIPVTISLEDVDEPVTATVEATRLSSGFIRWTFTVQDLPTGTGVVYRFSLRDTTTNLLAGAGSHDRNHVSESFTFDDSYTYAAGTYQVEGSIQYNAGGTTHSVDANVVGDQTITIP